MQLSRREFITLGLAGMGGVLACACGGAGLAAYLISQRSPAAESLQVATSAVNRLPQNKVIDRPPIIPRADWGALEPNHQASNEQGFFSAENNEGWRVYEPDIRDIYATLVVHHSVVDESDDLASLLEIQRLHRQDRQWADVAYHFFIGKDGSVYEGRAIDVRGSHVAGYNTGSVGVCLLGNLMLDSPTEEQLSALAKLGEWLRVRLQLSHLAAHRDFNAETLCPGDNLAPLLPELASQLSLSYGTGGYLSPSSACYCSI